MATNKSFGSTARAVLATAGLMTSIMIMAGVVFLAGRPEVSRDWVFTYSFISAFGLIGSILLYAADFSRFFGQDNIFSRSVFLFEERKVGSWSVPVWAPMLLFGLLAVLVFGGVTASEQSIFPIHPYAQSLSFAELSIEDGLRNLFTVGLVPGWAEDIGIFFAIQATAFLLILPFFFLTRNKAIFESWIARILSYAVSISLWAGLFAWFHGRWGSDGSAYIAAFIFQWVMQVLNFSTGFFGSWIVHASHNIAVTAAVAFSFTLAAFLLIPRPRGWLHE